MSSPPEADINRYAEQILADIDDDDVAAGALPANVRRFGDLHSYLDANDYLHAAQVPYDASDTAAHLIAAVQDEVTRRLNAPDRPWCTFGTCTYPRHDHTTTLGPDGADLPTPAAMRCDDCGQPSHYDAKLGRYRHDNPAAADCSLIRHDPR